MDEREQQRKVRHRLSILRHAEEVSYSLAATCRYYGISRHSFYKWRRRFEELGEDSLRDGSRRPLHSPAATDTEIVGKRFMSDPRKMMPGTVTRTKTELYDALKDVSRLTVSPNNDEVLDAYWSSGARGGASHRFARFIEEQSAKGTRSSEAA
jgi:transposase-like protein